MLMNAFYVLGNGNSGKVLKVYGLYVRVAHQRKTPTSVYDGWTEVQKVPCSHELVLGMTTIPNQSSVFITLSLTNSIPDWLVQVLLRLYRFLLVNCMRINLGYAKKSS